MTWFQERKNKYIKDAVWGSIPILPWEEVVIDHFAFTRLHNTLQNSTAFRVYPCVRVSRFAHSLGVMHVAGEIFRATVLQSTEGVIGSDDSLDAEALALIESGREENKHLDVEALNIIASATRRVFRLTLDNGEDAPPSLYCLLVIVRLAALLHDVGHLPFSHVFEFAVQQCVKDSFVWTNRITEKDYKGRLKKLIALEKTTGDKLHELFGGSLMDFLATNNKCSGAREKFILSLLIKKASDLLHLKDKHPVLLHHNDRYPISKSFVSGMIDADRIDFIRRDTQFSGLLTSSVDYGRLFAFFQLQRPHLQTVTQLDLLNKERPPYVAAPGNRALSDTEKLLWERFQEYKYIACHHKVLLNDELLERCIAALISNGYTNELLDSMLELTGIPRQNNEEGIAADLRKDYSHIMSLLTEFDDASLEGKARQAFRDIVSSSHEGSKKKKLSFSPKDRALITRYIEGTNYFESAFRTDQQFWEYIGTYHEFRFLTDSTLSLAEKSYEVLEIGKMINEKKYDWENEWYSDQSKLIIIGDVYNKLRTGIMADTLLNLENLQNFLTGKIAESPPFNFWYPKEGGQKLKKEICDFIVEGLTKPVRQSRRMSSRSA